MSNYYHDQAARMARRFKALSHPNRLIIFNRLVGCCPCRTASDPLEDVGACVGELGRELQIGPPTVSHHIKELAEAGLIEMERRGRRIRCWVEPDVLKELSSFFDRMPELVQLQVKK